MRSTLVCKIDNTEHKTYRSLSVYLKNKFGLSAQEYHDKFLEIGKCKECGQNTKFKNIQIGYRQFCSVLCLNKNKSKNEQVLHKISLSQKGVPRKKHSEETKKKCREIMLKEWSSNRDKRISYIQNETVRKKISKTISENGFKKHVTYIKGIRCESKLEEQYIIHCFNNNKNVKRFEFDGKKSIETKNHWRVPDYIENGNCVIDVKDFHHWFKKELNQNLTKYVEINNWCINHNLSFLFWIKGCGYKTIQETLNLWQVIKQKENV